MANSGATFKIKSALQVTGRQFFILGEVLSGTIQKGMEADLSNAGINKKHTVEAIEFASHRDGDKTWDDIALGFSDLTAREKELVKTKTQFTIPILPAEKNGD
jgi:translation elongation factor EF-Tu-like GTPase